MIVTCEACDTRFRLDDDRVPPAGVRVRCSCCHHGFFVSPLAGHDSGGTAIEGPMDEEDLSLSDDFDRAVEEDRAEVLAREQSSSVPGASPVEVPGPEAPGAEVPDAEVPDAGWGALEEDPADGATSEDNDPLFALEAGADEGAAPCHAEPTPLPRSSVPDREARPAVPRQAEGVRSTTSPPARVPRPPRLGRAATAVGWTLTLGLCALGLLWEIRATLGG